MPTRHRKSTRRKVRASDVEVSGDMIDHAVAAILRRVRVDRRHDVPYLAGYSKDGKTIYTFINSLFRPRRRRCAQIRWRCRHMYASCSCMWKRLKENA